MRRFRGSFSGHEFNHFFLNQGAGSPFLDVGYPFGLASQRDGRAVAAFDMDGDGLQDLAIQSLQGLAVYSNRMPTQNTFVRLDLIDAFGQPAIGASVVVEHAGGRVIDRVRISAGFHTQTALRLHIGIGQSGYAERVHVQWPSGARSTYSQLRAGSLYVLKEGQATPEHRAIPQWPLQPDAKTPQPQTWDHTVTTTDGRTLKMNEGNRARVFNLWAPWCEACTAETQALNAFTRSDEGAHLDVIGLLVGEGHLEALENATRRQGLRIPTAYAPNPLIKALFPSGDITLPTTLIFDAQGRFVRRINRRIGHADLTAYSKALNLSPTRTDLIRKADLQTSQQSFTAAYETLQHAEKLDPDHVPTFLKQVDVARRLGRLDFMTRALIRLTQLEPTEEKHWLTLIEQALPKRGPEYTLHLLKDGPDDAFIYRERGRLLMRLRRFDDAVRAYERALRTSPTDPSLRRYLTEAQHKAKKPNR